MSELRRILSEKNLTLDDVERKGDCLFICFEKFGKRERIQMPRTHVEQRSDICNYIEKFLDRDVKLLGDPLFAPHVDVRHLDGDPTSEDIHERRGMRAPQVYGGVPEIRVPF